MFGRAACGENCEPPRKIVEVVAAGKHEFGIFPKKSATYLQPRPSISTLRPVNDSISCQSSWKELLRPLSTTERGVPVANA